MGPQIADFLELGVSDAAGILLFPVALLVWAV
jgi:hypothetical protein